MAQIWLYSLVSVAIVSLISLVGLITLGVRQERLQKVLSYVVSFSAGALLGDVFIHILPEIMVEGNALSTSVYILAGIVLFFVLERFLLWHHSHTGHNESIHSMTYLTVFGDALHNFLDGMAIAASFLISVPVGIATTVAVMLHEIPQEIGQFAVLVHGGWSRKKALIYNFLSALTAVLGAVVVLLFTQGTEQPLALLAIGAASFIYVAMSDLIPELHKETSPKKSLIQLFWMIIGIGVMALMLLLE
ncbi:MAG: ZIP family metal transporter [bacterium]|nr:ZIP family metal transporter [bacterium]